MSNRFDIVTDPLSQPRRPDRRRTESSFNPLDWEVGPRQAIASATHSPTRIDTHSFQGGGGRVRVHASPGFLAILRRRLADYGVDESVLHDAVVAGENVAQLSAKSFGLITLRHTVHQLLDVEGFLRHAAAALQPSGFLVFEEPCPEALVLMATLCKLLPLVAAARPLYLATFICRKR